MSDPEICKGCGKPIGTGTLLDQFPDPPQPRTSVHRLYLLFAHDFSDFPTPEQQEIVVDKAEWESFASVHSCILCASFLDNEGARAGFD